MSKPRILIYDIETAPNLGYIWGKYEQNVIEYDREWYMLSFAYKWLDERGTKVLALPDFKTTYKKDSEDDTKLVEALYSLFNEADVVIAHNGDKFDQKRSNARFLLHGLTPPSPYKSVDTLKVSRKYFGFNSHKLDDIGRNLDLGQKVQHGGWKLWKGCMMGDPKSWKTMKRYNKQDVVLLEKVYKLFLPWIENHPTMSLYNGKPESCPKCSETETLVKNGKKTNKTSTYQQYLCTNCGGYARERTADKVAVKPIFVS